MRYNMRRYGATGHGNEQQRQGKARRGNAKALHGGAGNFPGQQRRQSMRIQNGIISYKGKTYATIHEMLVDVWEGGGKNETDIA